MDAAGDIVGISLTLTGGIAAGALLQGAGLSPAWGLALCTVLPLTLAGTALWLWRRRRRILVAALLFQLGLWAFLTEQRYDAMDTGPSAIERLALRCREAFSERIDRLPFEDAETGALVKALTTGDRSGLSRETTAAFRQSGASHILALSGLHLGILYAFLSFLGGAAGGHPVARGLRFALITGLSGAYVLMTGASPSLVRAFLFILLGETARLTRRRTSLTGSLCGALTLQLAFHPGAILSTGFQLSYLAMAGIALVYPPLKRLYPEGRRWSPMRTLWNAAALAIACQLTTAPLVWFRFHTFPRYFLLTNLLALPLTTLLMGTAGVTLLFSVLGWCPEILIKATELIVRSLIHTLTVIATM